MAVRPAGRAARPRRPFQTGLPSAASLMLPLVVALLAAPIQGRQPGDSFRPNTLTPPPPPSFQSSLQNALNSLAIPTASSFSATLAATTRFFASFSSMSTTSTVVESGGASAGGSGAQAACVPGEAETWPVPGTNCNMFYRCGGGRRPLQFHTCPPGKVYYAEYQDCEYPTAAWRCWEPICAGRVDGLYPDWSTNCRRSVRCRGGRVVAAIGCPQGQLSAGRGGCRPAHQVSCPRVSEGSAPVHLAPHQPAAPAAEPAAAHPLCWGRSPSLAQDRTPASRCRQYFRCTAGGQRSVETCPGNQVFDGSRCLDPEYYTCPVASDTDAGSSPCDRLPDGPHPQPGSRCRAYFRCSLGYKSVFVCSGDSVFDGERCVPGGQCSETTGLVSLTSMVSSALASQRPQPHDGVCAGKRHGYFADVATGCRGYVYCLSGAAVGTFRCEGGRRFDGRVCVDTDFCNGIPVSTSASSFPSSFPSSFSSSATSAFRPPQQLQQQPPQPQHAKQGFFADLQSGCRNYSFFIAGHETKLSCPPGLLFNGQLCVSENTYSCPTG